MNINEKSNLQSNFRIMYRGLCQAVDDFLKNGYCTGDDLEEIEAYLVATIHALMDYADRFFKDDDVILACRYVNNTMKHARGFVTYKEMTGGLSFPYSFPFECAEMKVIWKYNAELDCRYENQKEAYKKCFAGKILIETLEPLAERIESGIENKAYK